MTKITVSTIRPTDHARPVMLPDAPTCGSSIPRRRGESVDGLPCARGLLAFSFSRHGSPLGPFRQALLVNVRGDLGRHLPEKYA